MTAHVWDDETVDDVTPAETMTTASATPTHDARTLREWLADPSLLVPPPVVVPHLGWRGRSTLVAGSEKAGKSTLLRHAAVIVSTGGMFLGRSVTQGKVLWVGPEEHPGDIVRPLHGLGADLDNVVIVTRLNGIADLSAIASEHRPTLTIVDTLISYSDGAVKETSSSTQWQVVVQPLTTLAHDSDSCVLILHHARKSDGKYRDSSAIGGAVDGIAEMTEPTGPDARRDPTLRQLEVRGRMCSRTLTNVHLTAPGALTYELAGPTGLALDVEVLLWIQRNPGSAMTTIASGISRRRADVIEVLARLTADGVVEEHPAPGGARGARWHVTGGET